jgi:hypothetical protein
LDDLVGQEALGREEHKYGGLMEPAFERLRNIGERSPYASGQYPFLEEGLERRILDRTKQLQEEEWIRRRTAREQLFRLGPGHPGALIEEGLFRADEIRSPEELAWAEKRLSEELGFLKETDGQCIAYVREFEGYKIFGDPRFKGSLGFRVYKGQPDSVPQKKRRKEQPSISLYSLDFSLPDKWRYELEDKFMRLAREGFERLKKFR